MEQAKTYEIVDSVEMLEKALKRVREAQAIFATYSQEQVDKIFRAAAIAANKQRIPLAKMAVEETGMGVVEDKVIKNHLKRLQNPSVLWRRLFRPQTRLLPLFSKP